MDADVNAVLVVVLALAAAIVAALLWYVLAKRRRARARIRIQRRQPRRSRQRTSAAEAAAARRGRTENEFSGAVTDRPQPAWQFRIQRMQPRHSRPRTSAAEAAAASRGGAGNEFMGVVAAKSLPEWLWPACARLQAYLDDDRSRLLRPGGERLFIHPRVQAGALLGGQKALECSPALFWQLYELSFDLVVLGRSGRVVCACDLHQPQDRLARPRYQEGLRLKALACQATGLAYCSEYFVIPGNDRGPRMLGAFIAQALHGTAPAPAAAQAASAEERAFLGCLTCREQLFGSHGEDDFFFKGLQPLAREHGLRVFCQMPLLELIRIDDPDCLESLRRLSADYVLADDGGGIKALVELDGSSHLDDDARRRDALKNRACAAAGLRLVRVQRAESGEGRDDYTGPHLRRALSEALFDADGCPPNPRIITYGKGRDDFELLRPQA